MRSMRNIFAAVMLPFLVSACATSGGGSPSALNGCSIGGAVIGAITGLVVGGEAVGAVLGAGVGALGGTFLCDQQIAAKPAKAPSDKDGDGVPDTKDECAYTPKGSKVTSWGCLPDKDDDGVADSKDVCAYTPFGSKVDPYGCMFDKDLDGVADNMDKCAKTPFGAKVDANGCSKVNQTLLVEGIEFDYDSAKVAPFSQAMLDAGAITLLKKKPNINVRVVGHTDGRGSAEYNRVLSLKRAEGVREYMVANGISRSRLSVAGMGETRPIATNKTSAGRERNRRVEFIVVSK